MTKLGDRSDQEITDAIVACLRVVDPMWIAWFPDDSTLFLHVRDTLDELEKIARETSYAATGCMNVIYNAEADSFQWAVTVAYRYPDNQEEAQ